MAYLFDLTTLAEVLRTSPSRTLVRHLSQVTPSERWASVITVGQLLVAARREHKPRLMQDVLRLVSAVRVAPYDLAAAQAYAKLRAGPGQSHELDDVKLAATAVANGMTLVTRRTELFNDYPGLRLDDWTRE